MTIEQRLLSGAQRFNEQALAQIYDQYSNDLYRYAMRKLGQTQLAEDCVAETFSRFLRAIHKGGGPRQNLRAYLYRVAHNWITDHYRRRPPPTSNLDEVQLEDDSNLPLALLEKQQQERVRAAIAHLTPDQRQVIALKYYEGWKNKEIAETLEKPIGAIKALQHRAIAALRRMLLVDKEAQR